MAAIPTTDVTRPNVVIKADFCGRSQQAANIRNRLIFTRIKAITSRLNQECGRPSTAR
ncbi:hypothetical protein D3C76_1706050 [compost metagenome]